MNKKQRQKLAASLETAKVVLNPFSEKNEVVIEMDIRNMSMRDFNAAIEAGRHKADSLLKVEDNRKASPSEASASTKGAPAGSK